MKISGRKMRFPPFFRHFFFRGRGGAEEPGDIPPRSPAGKTRAEKREGRRNLSETALFAFNFGAGAKRGVKRVTGARFYAINQIMEKKGKGAAESGVPSPAVGAKDKKAERAKKRAEKTFSLPHYMLLMAVCGVLRLRFGAKSELSESFRAQKKHGAMLVLSNHVSAFDFAWFTTPFLGKKVSFVVAETMKYSQPIFAGLIDGYRAIVKKQFYADYTCIKNIKRYLDDGVSVILCPEGKVSADGRTAPMAFSIAKLVKWLGYPVASCVISGAGLTRPKWAHSSRSGGVVCKMDMMMTSDEAKSLSAGEIMERIDRTLAHNEHAWQEETGRVYRGRKYAEGLSDLLYRCPACGEKFRMTSAGNAIMCEKCGFAAAYTRTGKLLPANGSDCPDRIDRWYDLIARQVAEEVKREDFRLSEPVRLTMENDKGNGYKYGTAGTLTLDRNSRALRRCGSGRTALRRRPRHPRSPGDGAAVRCHIARRLAGPQRRQTHLQDDIHRAPRLHRVRPRPRSARSRKAG